jgi:hypothetical protein
MTHKKLPLKLDADTRDDMLAQVDDLEAPYIAELAKIDAAAVEMAERKRAIRDARLDIERLRDAWLDEHRDPDAGPEQTIGR